MDYLYFDHNSTTPLLPQAREAMINAMDTYWGNPSSVHSIGKEASKALEAARSTLADLLGVEPTELFFTSGGTESDNHAIRGVMNSFSHGRVACSAIEHPAVLSTCKQLSKQSYPLDIIPVDANGSVRLEELEKSLHENTRLISVMCANNEIGTLQPITEIGEYAVSAGIPFHCDAVQGFGKVPIDIKESHICLLSLSSHKIYGPKGCGALYIRHGTPFVPQTSGGSQEFLKRTGTQNLPAICGFVKAAEIAYQTMHTASEYQRQLSTLLSVGILQTIENSIQNGDPFNRIPNTVNFSFPGTLSSLIVKELDAVGICVSGGSACSSTSVEPNAILTAMGRKKIEAISAIRFSFGTANTKQHVMTLLDHLKTIIPRLRQNNS